MILISEGLDLIRVEHVDGLVLLREEQVGALEREKLRELELFVRLGRDALAEEQPLVLGKEV